MLDGKLIDFRRPHDPPAPLARGTRHGRPGLRCRDLWPSTANCSPATISDEGGIYLQVTRGAADRDFAFPENASPSLVMFTQAKPIADSADGEDRHEGDLDPRHPLGPARHQDGAAPLPLDGQDGGQEGRRRRRLDDRGRLRHRGHLEQRLYRHEIRHDRHPRPLQRRSSTASPAPRCCASPARRRWRSRNAPSPSTRRRTRPRPSSPPPPPS